MAKDPNARRVSINYDGGSVVMTVGNMIDLFGEDTNAFGADGKPVTRSVKEHDRVRVIGQPPKRIERYTHEFIQWPTNSRDSAAGGEAVVMEWTGSQGPWEARVSGPLWKLGTFLQSNSPKSVWFHAKGGKGYGPFQKIS
jgi:hypothetical protein